MLSTRFPSASIPAPPFDNLALGPVTFHGYGLIIGLAIVLAAIMGERLMARDGVEPTRSQPIMVWAVIGGFIGARLYHVASEPRRFADAPLDILRVWEGGLGIYGGVAGGAIAVMLSARRRGASIGVVADAAAPSLLAAQALGRVGNYLNQELFGGPSSLPWALEVDPAHRPPDLADVETFHPTFLYESLANLLLLVVFLRLHRRWRGRTPGVLFPLYVAAYSVVRIVVESLRIDPAHEWLGVRQNVWVAGVLVIAGLVVAAWMQSRARRRVAGLPGA